MFPHAMYEMAMILPPPMPISLIDLLIVVACLMGPGVLSDLTWIESEYRFQVLCRSAKH